MKEIYNKVNDYIEARPLLQFLIMSIVGLGTGAMFALAI